MVVLVATAGQLRAESTAQEAAALDIMPAKTLSDQTISSAEVGETHPPIKLTPDKSEIIKLDGEASSIIIGNPNHLNILAENAKTLVLVGRLPGATHFTVLDKDGNAIMRRHVIVASPKEKYVRIRKPCANGDDSCVRTQVYYCPDMCHEVVIGAEDDSQQGQSEAAAKQAQEASKNGSENAGAGDSATEETSGQ